MILSKLESLLLEIGPCVVAYSGGVDSTVVAYVARKMHGSNVRIVSFITPLLSPFEVEDARKLSDVLNLDVEFIELDPRTSEKVFHNDPTRCYLCKHLLFSQLRTVTEEKFPLVDGTNSNDLSDSRPGLRALEELGVRSPLAECEIDKQAVRTLARELGLPNANKPSAPCLATRFEVDTTLTDEVLRRASDAEEVVRKVGFEDFRVRDRGTQALVEIANSGNMDLQRLISRALRPYYESIEFIERS